MEELLKDNEDAHYFIIGTINLCYWSIGFGAVGVVGSIGDMQCLYFPLFCLGCFKIYWTFAYISTVYNVKEPGYGDLRTIMMWMLWLRLVGWVLVCSLFLCLFGAGALVLMASALNALSRTISGLFARQARQKAEGDVEMADKDKKKEGENKDTPAAIDLAQVDTGKEDVKAEADEEIRKLKAENEMLKLRAENEMLKQKNNQLVL